MPLYHDRLDVYQVALVVIDTIDALIEQMPKGRAHLKGQLDRSATSIVLNIAEGAGEFSRADKQRFYRMVRRSATESAATLDIIARRRHGPPDLLAKPEKTSSASSPCGSECPSPPSGTEKTRTGSGAGTRQAADLSAAC